MDTLDSLRHVIEGILPFDKSHTSHLDTPFYLGFFAGVVALAITTFAFFLRPSKIQNSSTLNGEWQRFKLIKKTEVSPNTAIYRFELPSSHHYLGLPIGQHIQVQAEIDGKKIQRSYTPISSDDDFGYFELMIKSYPQGNISKHIGELNIGDQLEVKGPRGQMRYSPHYAVQVIRAAMKNPLDNTHISLVYANVTEKDILLKDELDKLAASSGKRFKVHYVLDTLPEGFDGSEGRISEQILKDRMPGSKVGNRIHLCGPPPMINAVKGYLDKLGYEKPNTISKMPDQVKVLGIISRDCLETIKKGSMERRIGRDAALVALGAALSLASTGLAFWATRQYQTQFVKPRKRSPIEIREDEIVDGVPGAVGNTMLIRIKSLSELTGVNILGKAEYLNPGGSVKDRVSLQIIKMAEDSGLLHPHTGSRIFEGTVGSTGISIATMARALGYRATIIMPDDVAAEKSELLVKLGADVEKVRPISIVSKQHYVNLARQRAEAFGKTELVGPHAEHANANNSPSGNQRDDMVVTTAVAPEEVFHIGHGTSGSWDTLEKRPRGFFADQFENLANYEAHYASTGPEIWRQTSGRIDAFVAGAGTGGTLAGVAAYLKQVKPSVRIVLADPPGSGLYHKVKNGVLYNEKEAEGTRRRHQVDTVIEGIGLNRLTKNLEQAQGIIDHAIRVTDEEAVAMSRHLVLHDGLFLGSSSAVNLVAACRYAKQLSHFGERKTIVTILCDSGSRHLSKFWNDDYLRQAGIAISSDISFI